MKLLRKSWLSFLMACLMLFSSCSQQTFDAASYVQSVLDSLYRGNHEEYCKYADISEEEAEKYYREHLKSESFYFSKQVGLIQTDRTLYRTMAFYQRIYNASQYEAVSSRKTDGGFDVEMKISPLTLFTEYEEEIQNRVLMFSQQMSDGKFEGQTQEDIDRAYCDELLGFLEGKLDDPPRGESQTITIHLREEQGTYIIDQKEMLKIDRILLPYETEKK